MWNNEYSVGVFSRWTTYIQWPGVHPSPCNYPVFHALVNHRQHFRSKSRKNIWVSEQCFQALVFYELQLWTCAKTVGAKNSENCLGKETREGQWWKTLLHFSPVTSLKSSHHWANSTVFQEVKIFLLAREASKNFAFGILNKHVEVQGCSKRHFVSMNQMTKKFSFAISHSLPQTSPAPSLSSTGGI